MLEFLNILIYCLIILNIFCSIFVLYYEIKNPEVMWAWILIILIIPLGIFLYLIFGFEGRKHKKFLRKYLEDEDLIKKYNLKFKKGNIHLKGNSLEEKIIKFNANISNNLIRENEDIKLFHNGYNKFKSLFEDIKNAKTFIHLEYYIIRDDYLGKELVKILGVKAKNGVEVKLLYDGMGNIKNSKNFYEELIKFGGEVKPYLSPYFFRVNYRNHRKICVIDGKIGYIGGFNIGKEYLGDGKFKHWQDEHIKIVGESVQDLELRFICDWNFCTKYKEEKLDIKNKYFPKVETINNKNNIKMQIVNSGSDCKYNNIHSSFFKMITIAKEDICILTPYFIPDESMLTALKISALSGVKIKIIFPSKPDHPFVYWANISYLGELLRYGIKCYKYKKGFLHSKLILIDKKVCSIGTANMDIRSFKLNFETTSYIYNNLVVCKYWEKVEEYLKFCEEFKLEEYENMGKIGRLKEAISRLISPTL